MHLIRRLRAAIARIVPPKPRPLILLYHRVADRRLDPWQLAVSPAHFNEQIDVLRRTRHPFRLSDFVRAFRDGTLPANAVAVTFDDGYVDNLVTAKPALAASDVPGTVFLATGYLSQSTEFWWDELARLILAGDCASAPHVVVNGVPLKFDLSEAPPDLAGGSWRALIDRPHNKRQAAFIALWRAFRSQGEEERQTSMAALRRGFSFPRGRPDLGQPDLGRPMTQSEVRKLIADGLIEIGAHSVTHPLLPDLDTTSVDRELSDSRATCENLAATRVTSFAYPYGAFDTAVRRAVKNAGYDCACSTAYAAVTARSDTLALPRIHVLDWDGDRFEWALRSASVAG